jgi:hypothetical protein
MKTWIILTIVAPIAAVALLAWWDQRQKAAAAAALPKPWHYDEVLNQHWDPDHNHWHSGPPPATAPASPGRQEPAGAPPPSTPTPAVPATP